MRGSAAENTTAFDEMCPSVSAVDVLELVERYPRLFHMAEVGTWPAITTNGLLSTTALLDLFEITGPTRVTIESQRRPAPVRIHHPTHGTAWIRDNLPLIDKRLAGILDGCTVPEFYRLLNRRVFLWANEQHLHRLLAARAYRDRSHTVITVDTQKLVDRNVDAITLSRINSGATLFGSPPRRGPASFERIADFAPRTADGRRRRNVVEVAVEYGIADITAVAVAAHVHQQGGTVTELWRA